MRRTTGKSRGGGAARRGEREASGSARSVIGLKRVGAVVLWAGSFVALAYGLHWLEPHARAANGSGEWRLEWMDVAPTVDRWILGEIEQERDAYDLRPLLESDIHTAGLCEQLATALAKSPWIAQIEQVRKQSSGVVGVRARIREYATFVVRNGMGYLVDESGVRLPRTEPASFLDPYEMIVVEGVQAAVPALGERWSGEAVAGGLALVKFLHRRSPDGLRGSLKAVDVSNYGNRLNQRDGWLRIRTVHPGNYILWGLPPGEEYDIESSAERKLEVLWSLYSRGGRLPECRVIDIRGEDEILYRDAP